MVGKVRGRKHGSSGNRSVGITGDISTYDSSGAVCESYKKWNGMIRRVYSGEDKCYESIWVDGSWLDYRTFKKWHDVHYREGFSLDKDILSGFYGVEPHYSPDTCAYIPRSLNCKIINNQSGKYPRGVSFSKTSVCFQAQITTEGKRILRRYNTVEDAYNFFRYHHELSITTLANNLYDSGQIDENIFTALMEYSLGDYVWDDAHDGSTEWEYTYRLIDGSLYTSNNIFNIKYVTELSSDSLAKLMSGKKGNIKGVSFVSCEPFKLS